MITATNSESSWLIIPVYSLAIKEAHSRNEGKIVQNQLLYFDYGNSFSVGIRNQILLVVKHPVLVTGFHGKPSLCMSPKSAMNRNCPGGHGTHRRLKWKKVVLLEDGLHLVQRIFKVGQRAKVEPRQVDCPCPS